MPIFGQLVCGAAGSGKTSYCATLVDAKINYQTNFKVINLDPGAGDLPYEPYADIREIIDVVRIMDAKILGPNGALIYCFK
ncbi:MAG: GPN-loop GTPase 3 [Paramarteilia canceri]